MRTVVAVSRAEKAEYPSEAPYHPSEAYPEYPFRDAIAEQPNYAYAAVRDSFRRLNLDAENLGKAPWNPLGQLITPGMTVVLKPNFVRSRHYDGKDPYAMITHPSVLRAVADYVWIALKGSGRIIIGDAPNFDADWEELLALTKLPVVRDFYSTVDGPDLEVYDFRDYWGKSRVPFLETRHMPSCERKLPGDPEGELLVNLGRKSALYDHPNPEKFYGAVFDRKETIKHHSGERQEYKVSRTVMNADVVISVPKLKVHKRSGVTLNVKGLVGICTNKNFLVHYILGEPSTGGDQVPDGFLTPRETKVVGFERWMYDHFLSHRSIALEMAHRVIFGIFYLKVGQRLGFRVSREKRLSEPGNWYGNDSTWRMATDLLKVVMFGAKDGTLTDTPQRRLFSVVDGIIGGEKKGPLTPDAKPSAVVLASENYLAADVVAARLMGFDPLKLKVYRYLLHDIEFDYGIDSIEDIEVRAEVRAWVNCLEDATNRFLNFEPYPSWAGHVEAGESTNGNGGTNGR